jgi:hypothetical protein
MIITKADIGRKAVARRGDVWTILREESDARFPIVASNEKNGDEMCTMPNGRFFDNNIDSRLDLIRWSDETEDAQ